MDETVAADYDGVVVGWDLKFSFRKVAKAATILNSGKKVCLGASVEKTDHWTLFRFPHHFDLVKKHSVLPQTIIKANSVPLLLNVKNRSFTLQTMTPMI